MHKAVGEKYTSLYTYVNHIDLAKKLRLKDRGEKQ
jgi:hypothetical protein